MATDEARSGERAFALCVGLATAAGLLLRVLLPELRPIHHDESVNWYFANRVLGDWLYEYDPANYHGPTFHYLAALGRALLGDRLLAMRMPVMLAGAAMVPLCIPLRRVLGRGGAAGAAWAVALSPSLVYFARDAIHETLLAGFSLLALVGAVRLGGARPRRRTPDAAVFGVALGAMAATKETAVITWFGWGVGALLALLALGRAGRERVLSRLRGGRPGRDAWIAALAAVLVVAALFTGLRRPQALLDIFRTLQIWAARGAEGAGHEKPWHVFAGWLFGSEGSLLAATAIAAVRGLRRRDATTVFLLAWTATALAAYSAIHYKTPWCLLQVALPAALLAGQGLGDLARIAASPGRLPLRLLAGTAATTVLLGAGASAVDCSFLRHDDREVPLVYVQTHRELHEAMQDVIAIRRAVPQARVRHLLEAAYPFNWYLRPDGPEPEPWSPLPDDLAGADVLIVEPAVALDVPRKMSGRYLWRRFRFRDTLQVDLWVAERHRGLLADPEGWRPVDPEPAAEAPPGDAAEDLGGALEPGNLAPEGPAGQPAAGDDDSAGAR